VSSGIPYATEPRPDTGVSNAALGMWLFIASEVMLFGSLFSSYVLLRTGAASWPDQSSVLNVPLATVNTVVLVLSSLAIVRAAAAAAVGDLRRFRTPMAATVACGVLFLALKAAEYSGELSAGLRPATSNFLGLYFTMTGLHALHVAAGVAVNSYLGVTAPTLARFEPSRFATRVRMAALYWNFVDVVWLAMFAVLYLL
jgi:cytochrome c oxidase subunit III